MRKHFVSILSLILVFSLCSCSVPEIAVDGEITPEEQEALDLAQDYAGKAAKSAKETVEYLIENGYPEKVANAVVKAMESDFAQNAIAAAKGYVLEHAYTREELIEQLEKDGFSAEEAEAGAEAVE